jgi:hypothetical protein
MFKKTVFLAIALLAVGFTAVPAVLYAQDAETAQEMTKNFLVGTWEYKSRFSPSKFVFTADTYAYYRGSDSSPHTSGKYIVSGSTVKLLNESGYDFETIIINGNSFEFWGSTFTKE